MPKTIEIASLLVDISFAEAGWLILLGDRARRAFDTLTVQSTCLQVKGPLLCARRWCAICPLLLFAPRTHGAARLPRRKAACSQLFLSRSSANFFPSCCFEPAILEESVGDDRHERMRMEALYRRPRPRSRNPATRSTHTLLRGMAITRLNQVWAHGHHLYPAGARLRLSGRGARLVQPSRAVVAFVDHHGSGVLRRDA